MRTSWLLAIPSGVGNEVSIEPGGLQERLERLNIVLLVIVGIGRSVGGSTRQVIAVIIGDVGGTFPIMLAFLQRLRSVRRQGKEGNLEM